MDCTVTDFIRGYNPVWSMVDLDGKQFDDTYYLWVLQNTVPYNPATVYHDASGTIPWTTPIQFLANGTLPIDIYYADNTLYRLEIRHNLGLAPPSQADPLIYLVEDYNPSNLVDNPSNVEGDATDNQISNAQFANINFGLDGLVLTAVTNPDPINVAPGWDLVMTGTGSVTVTQVALNSALSSPTNAPYALRIVTSGWANQPYLRQRFQQNGQNWANKVVAGSLTGLTTGPSVAITTVLYSSLGSPLGTSPVISGTLGNTFEVLQGNIPLPASTNTDLPPNAYIEYRVMLPTSAEVYLTSFQLIISDNRVNVPYQQDTVDREIDHLFHYYQPKIQYMPIPSYLVGWDFPLNPAQFLGDSVPVQAVGTNKAFYAWDQTMVYQTADSGVSVSRAANGGLTLTSHATGQVALVQYLDQITARKILSDKAAVRMSLFGTGTAIGLTGNVTLWATTDDPIPTLPTSFITALDATGVPTGSGAWVKVPNLLQNTVFEVPVASATNSEANDINLNGWDMAGAAPTNTAKFFAIVIGFSAWGNADTLTFNSVSLCPGDIATRPAPKSFSETLLACQRYYFKTFNNGTVPVQNAGAATGEFQFPATVAGANVNRCPSLFYPVVMRTSPAMTYFNPLTAAATIVDESISASGGAPTTFNNTAKSLSFSALANAGTTVGNVLAVHIVADARLGVVN